MLVVITPLIALIITYIFILKDYIFDFNNPIKTLIDFGYPLGDSIYISITLIIFIFSRNILDGIMMSKARLLLIALIAQYIADSIYIYKSSEFYAGNYIDFLYLIAYFIMVLALLHLKSLQVKVKNI